MKEWHELMSVAERLRFEPHDIAAGKVFGTLARLLECYIASRTLTANDVLP